MSYFLLVVGITALVKGADWFVRGSSQIALFFKVSPFVIGLTVVAFGTSAPEAAVSFTAAIRAQSDLAYGNIIGSSMANLLLVLGLSVVLTPIAIKERIIKKEFPFAIFIVVLVFVFAIIGPAYINRFEGAILLIVFIVFLGLLLKATRKEKHTNESVPMNYSLKVSIMLFFLGLISIIIGGHLVTTSASEIALSLGMSEVLVGLSIVAVGTSLPELATIVAAWIKKEDEMALGNIIGSNIFNLSFILGASALISPIQLHLAMRFDLILLLAITVLAFIFSLTDRLLSKKEGIMLMVIYALYLVFIILRN